MDPTSKDVPFTATPTAAQNGKNAVIPALSNRNNSIILKVIQGYQSKYKSDYRSFW